MKELKALVGFASYAVTASPGQVFTCSDEQAVDLVHAGYAVELKNEKAVIETPKKEKAVIKNEDKPNNKRRTSKLSKN